MTDRYLELSYIYMQVLAERRRIQERLLSSQEPAMSSREAILRLTELGVPVTRDDMEVVRAIFSKHGLD